VQLLFSLATETGLCFYSAEISIPPNCYGQKRLSGSKGIHLNAEKPLVNMTVGGPGVLGMHASLERMSLNLVYPDELTSSSWLPTVFAAFKELRLSSLDLDLLWLDFNTIFAKI
jgi:hypothetical protein